MCDSSVAECGLLWGCFVLVFVFIFVFNLSLSLYLSTYPYIQIQRQRQIYLLFNCLNVIPANSPICPRFSVCIHTVYTLHPSFHPSVSETWQNQGAQTQLVFAQAKSQVSDVFVRFYSCYHFNISIFLTAIPEKTPEL